MKQKLFPICIVFVASVILLTTGTTVADEVHSKNQKGNKLFKQQQYDDALKMYDDALLLSPADPALKLNKGSAHYKLGAYDKAEESYTSALSTDNKRASALAHYNLGNSLFRQGRQLYSSGDQKAQEKLKAALEHYIQAIDMQPNDKDTKWNLQLTQQVLKQLKEQQQDQDKDKDKQDKKDKKDQKDQKDKQDQDSQDKKDEQDKDQDKQDQDKKDQDKKDQDNQDQDKQDQDKQGQDQDKKEEQSQKPAPQPQESKEDLKKEEALRLIEQFADDADSLNKPPVIGKARQNTLDKDW